MRKKVMILCEAMGGGVRRHLLDILNNEQLNSKYEFHLVYSPHRADQLFLDNLESLKLKGIYCYENEFLVREVSIYNDLRAFIETVRILKKVKPDILHCHSSKAGAVGRAAAIFCKVKKVFYTPHAYSIQSSNLKIYKRLLYLCVERFLSHFTTKIINVSYGEQKFAIDNRLAATANSVVIYNGIAESDNMSEEIVCGERKQIVVGTAARYDEMKDPYTFYEIAKRIVEKHNNVTFVYIGGGNYRKEEMISQVKANNLNEKIKLLGFENNVINFIKQFDIYLSTSLYEGLPYSLIEALSCHVPVVATNVIGNNEIVHDGFNGLLFEPGNVSDGVQKIEKLLKDKNLLEQYGKNSYVIYNQNFKLDDMINSLDRLYEN